MPTYRQADFIARAIESLLAQTFSEWELVIVDDGSPDHTRDAVAPYLADSRVCYVRSLSNEGLGAALNRALQAARGRLVAYLPSDDVLYPEHLRSLVTCLEDDPQAVLAYSGVRNEYRLPGKGVLAQRSSAGRIDGLPLQLVQVLHRRTEDRWLERCELVTDDLDRMYWSKLAVRGSFVGTGQQTCEWVEHPSQRHKIVQEPLGGPNPYRSYYGVAHPLRFHTTVGNVIDEVGHYRRFRDRPDTPTAPDGLKILLVGELAFNPERVLALEERGHRLYGLWTADGHWFNTVGPVPFGHVTDLPRAGWREAVRELRPDIIYSLLNWEAVPFAHEVLTAGLGVPFVWHFKEGPFDCIANGTWPKLVDLLTRSDGQIYTSLEMREWFAAANSRMVADGRSMVLDGDLPKADWFAAERSARLSEADGEVHTVVPGGPIGLTPDLIGRLADHGIHVHFYGNFHRGQWEQWTQEVRRAAPRHFHVHPHVDQDRWVEEFSRYDAGWLHQLHSHNGGDPRRAVWGDLNLPARMATYAVAGLPMIQYDNQGSVLAMQSLARRLDLGVFYRDADELAATLGDPDRMAGLRASVWEQRGEFVFDSHADRLIAFFRDVIEGRPG